MLVTIIYVLVLLTMAAAVEPGFIADQERAGRIAIVEAAKLLLGPAGAVALLLGGLLATASSANASILASSRINFAMGRDRIVPPVLNAVHDRFSTPYRSIAITGGLILLFIVAGTVELLATLGSVLYLIIYGLLNIALIVMRETDVAEYDPSFRVPLYPFTPIAGTVLSFALIAFISPLVIGLSALMVAGAILWYFGYARTRTPVQGAISEFILDGGEELPRSIVSAAHSIQPNGGEYRVMVPLANPAHETDLITLASVIAKQRGGIVDAVHIVTVPDQTALEYAAKHFDKERAESEELLDAAERDARHHDVPFEKSTIFSHRSFEEIFDAARSHNADLVVMGWGPDSHGSPGRIESGLGDLTQKLPCDFIALRDRGFTPERILVPTAGGPSSDLSVEIAALLRREFESDITLLHIADDRESAEEFLRDWAADHELHDVDLQVETGEVDAAIRRAAGQHSMVILGATGRGLLSRLVQTSSVREVVEEAPCSVMLAERPVRRPLRERLFGRW